MSPWGLFDALRGKKALSIPHTSAWGNQQVSWDYYDPQVERLVKSSQGLRSTYEYNGAPDPAGRRMGFVASSDHRSTHMSFAAVYARGIDRAPVFEGLTARRTHAATDKTAGEGGYREERDLRLHGRAEYAQTDAHVPRPAV